MGLYKSKFIFVLILFLFCFSLFSFFTLAAERELETEYPEIGGEEKLTEETTLPEYVKYIFKLSFIIAGVIALAVLIYGGFRYLTSAGSPVVQNEAKNWLFGGILGLVLLLSSYLILVTINPELTILELQELGEGPSVPSTTPPPPGIKKTTYQEIPIGTLVENLLAKNIDCYNYNSDGNMIAPPAGCPCAAGSGNGGKVEMMEDHDRLDCIKKLAEAVETKDKELKELAEKLEAAIHRCSCSNCSCQCSCPGNVTSPCSGEPCPSKGKIHALEEEIKKLVTGEGVPDPNFLSIREGVKRLRKMRIELQKDLDDLIAAEDTMKWECQYGTLLNLVKFSNLEGIDEYIDKDQFDEIDIRKYCIDFNCTEWKYEDDPKKKFCTKYELNDKGRLCGATTTQTIVPATGKKDIEEYFVFDGDPVSFYCLLEK